SSFGSSLGLDASLAGGLNGHLSDAARQLGRGKDACGELAEFASDVIDGAGKTRPSLTYAQAHQLLAVNQIVVALGCVPASSGRSTAEHDALALLETIAGFNLADQLAAGDLTGRSRDIGERIATGGESN